MMVASAKPFPDYQAEVVDWIQKTVPGAFVSDELPTKYDAALPAVIVEDNGGASDGLSLHVTLSISAFARDAGGLSGRQIARDLAAEVCSRMSVYPRRFGGIVADTVEVASWPSRSKAQEPDERTVCFEGEVSISLRR